MLALPDSTLPVPRSTPPSTAIAAAAAPSGAAGARATIADVAREAGVSKATVSRFLNHRETLLSPDIAMRVERAVAALGYSPSPMAQALKRGRTRLIGLVVADVTNPYSVAVLRGAEQACQEAGYLVMLFNLGNDSGREREAMAALASYQVEGFILNTLGRDPGVAAEALRLGRPVVLVDRRHSSMQADFVSLDNAQAMRMVLAHLQAQGYRQLLYVTEPVRGVSSRTEREAAFREGCHQSGHDGPALLGQTFENQDDAPEAQVQALAEALQACRQQAGGQPAAVLASNSVVMLRVCAALARLGWQAGRELGVVGFDDPDWAPYVGPGISTLAQPTHDLGRLAASCLLERLGGLNLAPRQILLPGQLRVRGSTSGLAAGA